MKLAILILTAIILVALAFCVLLWITLGYCLLVCIDPYRTAKKYQEILIIMLWPLVIPAGIILWIKNKLDKLGD